MFRKRIPFSSLTKMAAGRLLPLCCIVLFASAPLFAAAPQSEDSDQIHIQFGFRGQAKLGSWQPFLVHTPDRIQPTQFELTLLDGDDTPITYQGRLNPIGSEFNHYQGWAKIGRTYGKSSLRLFDVHNNLVGKVEYPLTGPDSESKIHESTRQMTLTLEPDSKLAKTLESSSVLVDGENAEIVVSIDSTDDLPMDWFCYEGIDTIFLLSSDTTLINQVSKRQWDAIDQWVRNGGRLIFSVASNGPQLLGESGPLSQFLPGRYAGIGEMQNSGRLESFANNEQLIERGQAPIPISLIEDVTGKILLSQNNHPLIIKQSHGLGQITFVAMDLDSDRISQWQGYNNLINRINSRSAAQESASSQNPESRGGSVSHYGYQDLVGQLRVALDRFSNVGFVAFTWIAVLIGIYILLIGPGDFFFLRKLVGKMELTWITFPAISLIFCGLAIAISMYSRPDSIQVNQLEIIDIDANSKWVRGSIWINLYSPQAGNHQVSVDTENALGAQLESSLISWHGLPGDGLGGMQTQVGSGLTKPGYRQSVQRVDESQANYDSSLQQMPIYVSSTKALFARWNGSFPDPIRNRLVLSAGSSRLEGTLTNPFDVTMSDVRLYFENYAYVLKKQELQPGETIDVLSEMKERTARSLLTRRTKKKEKDNRSHNIPWSPTDIRVDRIANMMMFYAAAGGNNYTGLTNDFQNFVDLTGQLDLKRAVLVGRIEPVATRIKIDGEPVADQYDRTHTIVRIVLPVTYQEKRL